MPLTTVDAPIRTALVGYGLAGEVFHAPLISTTDGFALTAVVTGNAERAAAARGRYPDVRVVSNVAELWRAQADLDLVVVAGPNSTHLPIGLAAIAAGLSVVIDKPVAGTADDARRLRDAAGAAGLLLSVFQNRRWDGDLLTVRQLVDDEALGSVYRFESRFERWRPEVNAQAWRERADPGEAGGLLYDLGSHLIDQAFALFGPVSSVYAECANVRPGAQVDDDVFVALTHRSGVRSHLWASSVAADQGPRFRVLGTGGSYVKWGLDGQEQALRAGGTPADPQWGQEKPTGWGRLSTPGTSRPVPTVPGAYQQFYRGIGASLRNGTPPVVTIDQAIDVLTVIEAAQRSAREQVTVALSPGCETVSSGRASGAP